MAWRRSQLDVLFDPRSFWWATGIEDTFITAPWPKTGRTLDEYELTGHYQLALPDIALMAELGVRTARYGVPWHRINPGPNQWDWDWTDRSLNALLEHGIDPIVDLVHYGLPPWIENAFLNPDFPQRMAEYSARLADRFKGRIHAYTPLNEPRITAWYCGKIGWWPPFKRGWDGFVQIMLGVCRGIVETVKALRQTDPEIVPVHVDATDLYLTDDPGLSEEASRRQDLVFLALDLVSGRIHPQHPLWNWLLKWGAEEWDLQWFLEQAAAPQIIGINLYPMFSKKRLFRDSRGLRIRMPYSGGEIVDALGRMYWDRYQVPLFISETASVGSVKKRALWLEDSVKSVKQLRADGIPLIGYTWWPMFALVTWAYRQGLREPSHYLKQMGLWDLRESDTGELSRVPTALVARYQQLVASGAEAVGPVGRPISTQSAYVS